MKRTTGVLAVAIALLSFTPQPNGKQQKQNNITISMPGAAWEVVLKGLGKLPLEESANVYSFINQQITIQSQAPADTSKPKAKKP